MRLVKRLAKGKSTGLYALLLGMLGTAVMSGAAVAGQAVAFAIGGCAGVAGDLWLQKGYPGLETRLGRIRWGIATRWLVRCVVFLALAARLELQGDDAPWLLVGAFVAWLMVELTYSAVAIMIGKRRTLPVTTRSIELPGSQRLPAAGPAFLTDGFRQHSVYIEPVLYAGIAAAAIADRWAVGTAVVGAVLACRVLMLAAVLPQFAAALRFPSKAKVMQAVDDWLASYRPDVVLYFSGSRDSAYQMNMWLETLEQLSARPLVILRERYLVEQVSPTSVPILCVPSAVHLMGMDLSSVKVALYPANVGKNIHLLRVPTIRHVFVGHGDSDKLASVNPYSKVYDEVWVAGPAGRERYALAEVGVRDDDIVEVGRPQLDALASAATSGGTHEHAPVVLYAPTWEGWTDDPGNTSLTLAGANIVRELLASPHPVRIIYKPHPFTGTVDPRAKTAHQRVVALLNEANAKLAQGSAEDRARAVRELAGIDAELARLQMRLTGADAGSPTEMTLRTKVLDTGALARWKELRRIRSDVYWRTLPADAHVVVEGPAVHLYDCFKQADLLISDISSVVSDFVATGKPYALTDTAELGADRFRAANTAARGAYILKTDATAVRELAALLHGAAEDPMADARARLRGYLLGTQDPSSLAVFDAEVARLGREADARAARQSAERAPVGVG